MTKTLNEQELIKYHTFFALNKDVKRAYLVIDKDFPKRK